MPSAQTRIDVVRTRFETQGPSWAERAHQGELDAVLSPGDTERRNLFLHSIGLFGAKVALSLDRNHGGNKGVLLDFGCGTGRFVRFFGKRYSVVGIDITWEMLSEARRLGLPKNSALYLTDGVSIPFRDQSVSMIWVCGVLKYSLFEPDSVCRGGSRPAKACGNASGEVDVLTNEPFMPVYREIAKEMYRVLKPGGFVVNIEMCVDAQSETFVPDFENVGFVTRQVRVLHRYGRLDKVFKSPRFPLRYVVPAGQLAAAFRFWFDDPRRQVSGTHDYLFVWFKPKA